MINEIFLKPTVIAIPIFAIFIAIEVFFAVRKESSYDRKDVWTNIALGLGSVLFGFLFGLFHAVIYDGLYQLAPYKWQMNTATAWIVLLFADDFCYYWFHRFSHEIRFFWNFHVVHHSSNHFNLSVAVRQSWFSGIAHWIFYLPISLIGFPFWAFTTMHGFNLIYQFWIHTKYIKKLPAWFEFIFNTPSHHRVHHGVNNPYLDKNYAGIFIIWDRLFGTFVEETEQPRYGILKPLYSYNWLWINTHAWVEMFEEMKKRKTLSEKFMCVFGSPSMQMKESVRMSSSS
ncbi:MAG: sterol desaturase family protein [Pyrinomonadaceae bacterium]|nr:sterol desaturase family protein [Pyrinomonadaceae bacterium]MCX7640585.1 sterol desaturase family protein [Pyrinomonadaceae bacterium]MDW8303834.1 sterol desaturase family protein [Acidobacteriota bacterium]